ncbi:hypothetical protein [Ranid herpesvirus 3]|uniref:Uncharacterized protein n=1 Tax=Ranid herpesvirus 3 TaxID=1987509 RepID=A0A1X9T5E9_9VIRU|nr:hypothetical protein [Ranid herpesvirus 3]ARR28923.1 hypothetical protein [Ranid herpesvirus 3]
MIWMILGLVPFTHAYFYTDRCAQIDLWYDPATNKPVQITNLVVGNTYRVYLSFGAEGVSVSTLPKTKVCDYLCLSEIIYLVTYTGHNIVCSFSSTGDPSVILQKCLACNHLCAHRPSSGRNRTSVDACLLKNTLSPLYQLWSVINVGGTLVVDNAIRTLLDSDACLAYFSGYDLRIKPDPSCVASMGTTVPHRTVKIRSTNVVQCRVKVWSDIVDPNVLSYGCTECVIDYLRIERGYVAYYGTPYQKPMMDVLNNCPGPVFLAIGGEFGKMYTATKYDVSQASSDIANAAQFLGAAGIQLEVANNLLPLFAPLKIALKRLNLTLDARFNVHPHMDALYLLTQAPDTGTYDRQILHHYNATSTAIMAKLSSYTINTPKPTLLYITTEDEIILTDTSYVASLIH